MHRKLDLHQTPVPDGRQTEQVVVMKMRTSVDVETLARGPQHVGRFLQIEIVLHLETQWRFVVGALPE
jgi:hypothetical protein